MTRQRKDPYEHKPGIGGWLWRLAFLFMVVVSCALAAVVLLSRYQETRPDAIGGGSSGLNTVERLYLQNYLSSRQDLLAQPAGSSLIPVSFTISPGETADIIAVNLATAEMLNEPDLFRNYLRFHGLDSQLEAGEFMLSPYLTIPELATTLSAAYAQDVELRFLEGWRMEEMAHYLAKTGPAQINADHFLAIVSRSRPFDLGPYDFLNSLPEGHTLEGYLFPDTYRVPQDADAAYLIDVMLQNFGRRVDPTLRQQFGAQGLSLSEAVTLAAIVEREAVVPTEKPLIAGVFLNRLAAEMRLEADPTTQYALGYQADSDSWWKSPLLLADLQVESPYNTYVSAGLPPGPIANPSLTSLQAVAAPAVSDFLFFVVDCTASTPGTHVFSISFAEHLANVQRCR